MQHDVETWMIEFSLYFGDDSWPVPEDVSVAVSYRKPDGTKGFYDKLPDGTPAITTQDNIVTVILAQQMLTVAGDVEACLVLNNTEQDQLASFLFCVRVEENPVTDAPVSQDYIRLNWLENKLEEHLLKIKASGIFDEKNSSNGPVGLNGHRGVQVPR